MNFRAAADAGASLIESLVRAAPSAERFAPAARAAQQSDKLAFLGTKLGTLHRQFDRAIPADLAVLTDSGAPLAASRFRELLDLTPDGKRIMGNLTELMSDTRSAGKSMSLPDSPNAAIYHADEILSDFRTNLDKTLHGAVFQRALAAERAAARP
jgi:hypothetical protein